MKTWRNYFLLCCIFVVSSVLAIPAAKLLLNHNPVVDQAGILSPSEEQTLNREMRQWYQKGIMQAGVVIVDNTNGEGDFPYAMNVFQRWQLGSQKENNGLLLLVNMAEHKIRIITGYGLEGVLPDISVKNIIAQDITPAFKNNHYYQGIKKGLITIAARLQADPATQAALIAADKKAQNDAQTPIFIFGSVFLAFIVQKIVSTVAFLRRHSLPVALLLALGGAGVAYSIFNLPAIACLMGGVFFFFIVGLLSRVQNRGRRQYFTPPREHFDREPPDDDYRGGGGRSGGGGAGGSW